MTSSSRIPLPSRRYAEAYEIEHAGQRFHIAIGLMDETGAPGEVFVNAGKVDSEIDSLAGDVAILISLLLQHGASPASVGHALRRNPNGARASLVGVLVDLVASHEFIKADQVVEAAE